MIQTLFKLLLASFFITALTACESEEDDLLFQAENCINEKSGTGQIGQCSEFLSSLDSPRANTLKCKITLETSGLDNQKITSALDTMDNSTDAEKEAHFMGLVSLNSLAEADEAAAVCTNTESPGLEFIADSARMGTVLVDQIARVGNVSESNPLTTGDLTTMLSNCDSDPTCEEAIGASAQSMYGIYCEDASITDVEVCADVNAAISGGGTDAQIGEALIALLEL